MMRILTTLIFLGGAIAMFFGLTIPSLNDIKASSIKDARLTEALKEFDNLEKIRNDILAKYGSISNEDNAKLDRALPKQISAVNLVYQIDDMAKSRGMILKNINIEEPKSGKKAELTPSGEPAKYNSVALVFTATGSYEVFLNFLSDLEKSLQVMDIKEISFNSSGKVDSYDFSVKAVTYYAGN